MGANIVLKQRMDDLGLTQEELAARMNDALAEITGRPGDISDRTVRNLLSGSTRRPIARTCAALEKVFGCSVEDLGFRAPRSAAPREDPVRRRTFMTSATGTAATAVVPALAGSTRAGQGDVARLQAKFAAIIDQDHKYGGLISIETRASALAGEALSLLQRGSAGQRVRSSLYAAAASFTSSAMWAAIDGRRFNEAQRYFDRASSLAAMSGDATIQFRIWSHAGTLYRHLGRPIDALAANDVARGLPVARRDPVFAALGHARHAAILGLTHDAVAVDRAIGQAHAAYARADPDEHRPAWMTAFFDQAEIESLALTAHLALGNYERAEAHAHRCIRLLRPHMLRSRAIATARLAHAQLGQGDLEPAVTTATRARTTHPRVTRMLEEFGTKLHAAAPRSQAAKAWDEYNEPRRDAE
ncbi:helix-turn-helix domain-containing protein [Actinacidiphila acididurans]|uniref:Helix-turn-helix transcriptional regulator n=1 Tax=Actinacidiphila acididurans TaxID=2784346 RepID=A0ABS2TZK7_9ACTN|nr:helix-turn-helix transcriptional regulator [Actinacidiphila acididurans]MBM9508764.1 helix-turn-helix transcriptional regulator [Actinacidiphila acididurans]